MAEMLKAFNVDVAGSGARLMAGVGATGSEVMYIPCRVVNGVPRLMVDTEIGDVTLSGNVYINNLTTYQASGNTFIVSGNAWNGVGSVLVTNDTLSLGAGTSSVGSSFWVGSPATCILAPNPNRVCAQIARITSGTEPLYYGLHSELSELNGIPLTQYGVAEINKTNLSTGSVFAYVATGSYQVNVMEW